MIDNNWTRERTRTLVCLDSYHNGVPEGRIYDPQLGVETFKSMSQFLIKMEALLDENQMPQSYTAKRTFPTITEPMDFDALPVHPRKGARATFEVQVLFRQHTSWQGVITWMEEQMEQSFRSVLELIILMDSALRDAEKEIA